MNANSQLDLPIKILLVDDLRVVREKLKSVLKPHRDLQVIGTAIDGQNAIEQLEWLHPDIILLDLDMPRLDGSQTAQIIGEKYPHIKIIILSSSEDPDWIGNFSHPCVKAYIIKGHLDREIVAKIRAVFDRENDNPIESESLAIDRDNIVKFDRFYQLTAPDSTAFELEQSSSSHSNFSTNLATQFTAVTQTTLTKLDDWSSSARELIDMMPLPWVRGSLYLLVAFVSISIPWACFYKMDEIGIARGRLEPKGNTIKREADIEGSVAVVKVFVKKGDVVKKGQVIMELDSKNVRAQLYQNQLKLDGAQQRLDRLLLMKNQVGLGTTAQQQQNQAQLLEKQVQIAQAQQSISTLVTNSRNQTAEKLAQLRQAEQTLTDRQSSYNLQKAEKLTQVRQAEQAVLDAQTNHLMAQNRLRDAQTEVRRYTKLYQTGAIAQVKTQEVASIALEKNQLFTQAVATLQQSKLRFKEQQENYQKLLQQARSDIAQARLRLTEQQQIYQGTIASSQSDVAQAKLRLTEQQRNAQSLTKGGNIAILKTDQQLKEIEGQIVTLNSEINRDRAQSNFLTSQIKKYTIEANTNGTIFELPIDREGAVVQPKQPIAEIAPNTSGLVFKGEIPATQSESLRSSLDGNTSTAFHKEVRLKFDEFPFESYDVVKGKLTWVAPNSKFTPVPSGGSIASYDIEVQLDRSCIKYEGNCIPFKSGQPATAEIVIRNRRIIDFILDPFKKLSNGNR